MYIVMLELSVCYIKQATVEYLGLDFVQKTKRYSAG